MDDTVIRVEGVSKKFARRIRHNMLYGTIDVARGMLGMKARTDSLRPGEFWAVNDVSFELKRGETLGLIGPNGSGKSTLLRLLNGIYQPDKGRIEIRGRVGALIAVGAGFHPLMTGRENIYLNGSILGMTRAEIDRNFDAIVDFADVGEFLDAPVKTYSSGMYVRLGFSIAIHCAPDILLVDEVLAVGDAKFQNKCFGQVKAFRESGKTVIMVTHDMDAVLKHCDRAALLDNGGLAACMSPKNAVNEYFSRLWGKNNKQRTVTGHSGGRLFFPAETDGNELVSGEVNLCNHPCYNPCETRLGNGNAQVIGFRMIDEEGRERESFQSCEIMRLRFEVLFNEPVETPVYGFMIRTRDGLVVYGVNNIFLGEDTEPRENGDRFVAEFSQNMSLVPGDYFISVGVAKLASVGEVPLDTRQDVIHLKVIATDKMYGIVNLESNFNLEEGGLGICSALSTGDA